MAKLLAPLANINEDSSEFTDFICATNKLDDNCNVTDFNSSSTSSSSCDAQNSLNSGHIITSEIDFDDSIFDDSFSGSLEDLVNTFDEKITKCFRNYNEQTDQLAPIQVTSHDEILSESTLWNSIVNNCGNIRPIDWNKSRARELQLRGLNIDHLKCDQCFDKFKDDSHECNASDNEICGDFDHHSLVSSYNDEAVLTAEQVLEEIDQIMHENNSGPDSCLGSYSSTAFSSPSDETSSQSLDVEREKLPHFTRTKLSSLQISQLSELSLDLEKLIQNYSEVLIQQLALRDELEYEKELKSTFISLVIGVQDKRHQVHVEKKKLKQQHLANNSISCNDYSAKYLTTVIPYHNESGAPNVQSLQILIKILRAMNEDSPTVPTLLTDYILKVICPT